MINWTGERLETFVINSTTIEHLHRYAMAMELAKNKVVLDIACGEGYGSNLLAQVANKVIGVDISSETILHAKNKYKKLNLTFLQGDAAVIPCETGSIDLVVSFETIEHHDKHHEMMNEIIRILKPQGILIMSSPDKQFYSIVPKYNNPFHVKELFENEFKDLVKKYFRHTSFFSQICGFQSIVINENPKGNNRLAAYHGDYNIINISESCGPNYWVVVASNEELEHQQFLPIFDGQNVLNQIIKNIVDYQKKSIVYRLGWFILSPAIFLVRFFRKN